MITDCEIQEVIDSYVARRNALLRSHRLRVNAQWIQAMRGPKHTYEFGPSTVTTWLTPNQWSQEVESMTYHNPFRLYKVPAKHRRSQGNGK